MDSTARLPLQSPVPFPCHRDLRCNGDFLGGGSNASGSGRLSSQSIERVKWAESHHHLLAAVGIDRGGKCFFMHLGGQNTRQRSGIFDSATSPWASR